MYTVTVRGQMMIAHSFRGDVFGPAQRLHGATYVVEAEFRRTALNSDGTVIDIGLAARMLHEVLAPLDFRNLDDLPEFDGRNSTTEVLAGDVFERLKGRLTTEGIDGLASMKITLRESPSAWATFEAALA